MSVNVRITKKSLFKKKLKIEDIVKMTNLSYGVCDENYRLIDNEFAKHTLLYDKNNLARGIDVSIENDDIILLLSLPTSSSEIRLFYKVIANICDNLKLKKYFREEELVDLNDSDKFIEYDEEASIAGLNDLKEKISSNSYQRFEIFGIYNPISIGEREVSYFNNDLEKFSEYLHHIQSIDAYYATPRVYKVADKLVGIYAIGSDIPSIVPIAPYIVLNQIDGISSWYVMLKDGKTVKYSDFIENINKKEYYDANHVIVTLSNSEVFNLIENFSVEIE